MSQSSQASQLGPYINLPSSRHSNVRSVPSSQVGVGHGVGGGRRVGSTLGLGVGSAVGLDVGAGVYDTQNR